jgi:signal transduction histidine kinase
MIAFFAITYCTTSYGALSNSKQSKPNRIADSLKFLSKNSTDPEIRFRTRILLAAHYQFEKPDSTYYFANEALNIARKANHYKDVVNAHEAMIDGFVTRQQTDSIWKHMKIAMDIATVHGDDELISMTCFFFGNVYESMHKRDSSLYEYLRAVAISKKIKNPIPRATIFHGISQYYIRQRDYDKALSYILQAYELRYKKDSGEITGLLSDIGNIYYYKGDYKTAMKYYRQSLEECRAKNVWWGYGYTLNNIGLIYEKQNEPVEAIKSYEQAMKYYNMNQNYAGLTNTAGNLARMYLSVGNLETALKYSRYAVTVGEGTRDLKVRYDNFQILSKIEEKTGNYREALNHERIADLYRDSMQQAEAKEHTTDLEIKYETSQKELEYRKLKEKEAEDLQYSKRQNQIAVFISVMLCLSLVITYLVFRNGRQQKLLNKAISIQKRELEETDQFKSKLFSIISHDFRAPLTTLKGFLYLIDEDMLDKPELLTLSRTMQEQLNTTSGFIDNLLFWAQSQLKGYQPFIHKVSLSLAVVEIFDLYKNAAASKNTELINRINEDIEVETDANMVRLVLRNLVSNAIKYTASGEIIVSCERVNTELIICVTDSGVGMAGAIRAKLFTGERITMPGTSQEKGTGLGLMLCKEFVEANGGQIQVESEEGRGSRFCFSIPVSKEKGQKIFGDTGK